MATVGDQKSVAVYDERDASSNTPSSHGVEKPSLWTKYFANVDPHNDSDMATALENYVPDTNEEKKLVRKIDWLLLPCLWWMYILAYLDRGNIVRYSLLFLVLFFCRVWQGANTLIETGQCQRCGLE